LLHCSTYCACATDRSLGRGRVTEGETLLGSSSVCWGLLWTLCWRSFLVPETSTSAYQLLHYCHVPFHCSPLYLRVIGYGGILITVATYSAFSLGSGHWSCFGLVIHIHQKQHTPYTNTQLFTMQSSLLRTLFARQDAKSGTDELVDLLSGGFEGEVRSHGFPILSIPTHRTNKLNSFLMMPSTPRSVPL
jgi:hypothetical protein